ncbi:methyltransferase [Nocardia jiangsuensis]|uniref:Methyltransferase n=1 Tax=Nocardia jiangsuensis TaxID=1691563 RepID=A0ABV8DRX7_9NOCA
MVARLRAAGCVFAEDEARLLIDAGGELEALVARRVGGEPLEQILGWAEFRGLRVGVAPGVFVPRARTAELVDAALPLLRAAGARPVDAVPDEADRPAPVLVDLCCGTGALGLACAREVAVQLVAADIEPAAVACARLNLGSAAERGDRVPGGASTAVAAGSATPTARGAGTPLVYRGDLFDALPDALRGTIAVLLANVPYVPSDAVATLPLEAREHEPRRALDGGADGLDVLRRVVARVPEWLAPGGHVLMETSAAQADPALQALAENNLAGRLAGSGEHGTTVVIGTLSSPCAR